MQAFLVHKTANNTPHGTLSQDLHDPGDSCRWQKLFQAREQSRELCRIAREAGNWWDGHVWDLLKPRPEVAWCGRWRLETSNERGNNDFHVQPLISGGTSRFGRYLGILITTSSVFSLVIFVVAACMTVSLEGKPTRDQVMWEVFRLVHGLCLLSSLSGESRKAGNESG